jgi:ferritin
MPGIAIKPRVLAELVRQLNHELSAAYAYESLAHWCEYQNFKGFARYFHKQAGEERAHARKFTAHLLDRGVLPELHQVPAPKVEFESLLDIARQAQSMERANTVGIHQAYDAALAEKDFPSQVLLHWFINEQVEEEDWADEMVERVEAAGCSGGIMDLRPSPRALSLGPGRGDRSRVIVSDRRARDRRPREKYVMSAHVLKILALASAVLLTLGCSSNPWKTNFQPNPILGERFSPAPDLELRQVEYERLQRYENAERAMRIESTTSPADYTSSSRSPPRTACSKPSNSASAATRSRSSDGAASPTRPRSRSSARTWRNSPAQPAPMSSW